MKVLLACGGSGGDLFPGIALAEAFEEMVPNVEIVFVGTPRGLEKEILQKTHWRLKMIPVQSLADKKGIQRAIASLRLFGSLAKVRGILKKENPDLIVGIGNYASGPTVLTASFMKKKTLILEPNSVPGLTNRWLKPFVDKVVVAYPHLVNFFGKKKTSLLGVPVRKSLLKSAERFTLHASRFIVFIFGGSQGAKKINEAMMQTLPYLKDLKDQIHFIHQIGKHTAPSEVESQYSHFGFSAEVHSFIEDMGSVLGKASFVICRAGATSLAELVALAKPALLIPYPFAARNHQETNARFLEKQGGVFVLLESQVTGEKVADRIRDCMQNPSTLEKMSKNLKELKGAEASSRIVEECLQLVRHGDV